MDPERDLNELSRRVQGACGTNARALLLYGSAAAGEFHKRHSDLNTLCLLNRLDGEALRTLRPVTLWWWRKGHPAPLLFTLEELRNSADVFAIELMDMKQSHRILLGDDFLAQIEVPMDLHRLQVERELRTGVIRLRQAYLRSHGRRSEIVELMIASASSFAALFRHSLIALGETAPDSRRSAADRLAARLGFDPSAYHLALDLREEKRSVSETDVEKVFAGYLDAVTCVAQEMDRCLAAS